MKKSLTIIGGIIIICLIVFSSFKSCYNEMVAEQEKATTAWSNVQSAYQRRADLIPNLVETVKGYAKHEEGTLTEVINARSKATQVTVDPANLTPEKLQEFQKAQGDLSSALGKLLAIQEAYPDLKANENFKDLQAQLEGTENRITVERQKFNETAQSYNTQIRSFPTNLIAGLFNFDKKGYFKAAEGADVAPKVEF